MKSSTTSEFWRCYSRLPPRAKQLARRAYKTWAKDPNHGSLHFKKVGRVWSVRVGLKHRAVGLLKHDMSWKRMNRLLDVFHIPEARVVHSI